jgi:hypothetical protein
VAVHHQGAAEACLPVEEAVVDPGPARLGEEGPRHGQELVGVGMRIEPAMDEQRVAEPHMAAHAPQAMDHSLSKGHLQQGMVGARPRLAGPHAHLIPELRPTHALGEPHRLGLVGVRPADHGEQHHDLMVAHQPVDMVDAVGFLVCGPLLEYADAVGSAIDHVAEVDQPPLAGCVGGQTGDGVEQHAKLAGAAVHVADREHGLAAQRERGWLPVRDLDRQSDGGIHARNASPIRRGAPLQPGAGARTPP